MEPLTRPNQIEATTSAETQADTAIVRLMQFNWTGDFERRMQPLDCFWLDQCVTPRPQGIRGCFPAHSGEHNFVPLGDLIIVPPGESLHVRSCDGKVKGGPGQQESIVCCLENAQVDKWCEHELTWSGWTTEALDVRSQSMRGLLWRLIREVCEPGFAGHASIEMLCGLIAIDLARYCAKIEFTPPKGGLAAWRLRLIDEMLNQAGKPPTLSDLATACNISLRQLMRGFSVSRGCTLGAYIEAARLARAQRMLTQGAKVKSVAHALGFASAASFCGAFKRRTGVSPGEYRARA